MFSTPELSDSASRQCWQLLEETNREGVASKERNYAATACRAGTAVLRMVSIRWNHDHGAHAGRIVCGTRVIYGDARRVGGLCLWLAEWLVRQVSKPLGKKAAELLAIISGNNFFEQLPNSFDAAAAGLVKRGFAEWITPLEADAFVGGLRITSAGRAVLNRLRGTNRDEWLCGYAAALANVDRQHDQPQLVYSCMVGDGISVQMLVDAGVEEYDLDPIKKAMKSYGR